MKLTYTITEAPEPGMMTVRTELEDEEPLIDITMTLGTEIVHTQFPAIAQTLMRAWFRKNGWPMPDDRNFKTLAEAKNGAQ